MSTQTQTQKATKATKKASVKQTIKVNSAKVKQVKKVTYLKSNVTGKDLQALSKQGTLDYKTAELSFSKHLTNLEKYDMPLLKSFVKYNKSTFVPMPILKTMSDLEKFVSVNKKVNDIQVIDKNGNFVREFTLDSNGKKIEKFFTYQQVKRFVIRYYKAL